MASTWQSVCGPAKLRAAPDGSVLELQPRVPAAPPGLRSHLPTDGRSAEVERLFLLSNSFWPQKDERGLNENTQSCVWMTQTARY